LSKKWGVGKSDHAVLIARFKATNVERGKGIIKLNGKILEDNKIRHLIKEELNIWLANISDKWDPHTTWEYCKMALRSITLPLMSNQRKEQNNKKENF
jgi:hypothetical protein